MKVMPFRVADDAAVEVSEPLLVCGEGSFQPHELVTSWDYLSEIQIATSVKVHEEVFRSQTGMTGPRDLEDILVILQADCHSTGTRHTASIPLVSALNRPGSIELSIPPATVAGNLDVHVHVILNRPDAAPRADRAAHLRGSRLHDWPDTWRFGLEGTGSAFPTEAVDFCDLGLPADAAWHLRIQPDPALPFMGAVRLQVNHAHPAAQQILGGNDSPLVDMLFHDLLLQMLLALLTVDPEDLETTEEDSLGAVLEGHCATYLHCSLLDAMDDLRRDPTELITRLKAATRFAAGVER